jgi:TolB-like protein/lipoprotein NlpI
LSSRLEAFLSELKRRRVYDVAGSYIVVGVGVLGAAEVILDPLGLAGARRPLVVLVLLGFPIAVALAWAYRVAPEEPAPDPLAPNAPAAIPPSGMAPEEHGSVAVLPFEDLSPDHDHEYFSHGLSEEIINSLAHVRGLKVAARTSSFLLADRKADIATVGRTLGVAHVLEGSVRRSGGRLRITAQLIEAASGFHEWSTNFDRELTDVFEIQDAISRAIVERLVVTLRGHASGSSLVDVATSNREAYEAYLRARYHWNQRTSEDLQTAIAEFRRAIGSDPAYAKAYSGLADAYNVLEIYPPRGVAFDARETAANALAAARRAVELAPQLGMARASLGRALMKSGEWQDAEREFTLSLQYSPGYSTAHLWYGLFLWYTGRVDESVTRLEEAKRLDPVSQVISAELGLALYVGRRAQEAVEELRRTTRLAPMWSTAWRYLAAALVAAGEDDEALRVFIRRDALRGGNVDEDKHRAAVAAMIRYRETGVSQELPPPSRESRDVITTVFRLAMVGQKERALAVFEGVVARGAYEATAILHVAFLGELLRDDPRYRALLDVARITW